MARIVSERSVYFFDADRNRIGIPKGESSMDDAMIEKNADVKAFIENGIVRVKGDEPQVVDEAAETLRAAQDEAAFWKACYEKLAALAPKKAKEAESGQAAEGDA